MKVTLVALALVLAALGGHAGAGDGGGPTSTPVAGPDNAYCRAYRTWKVYELDAGGAFDQPNPASLRAWWNAYLVAEETMLQQAPPEIRDEVGVKLGYIRTRLTPLLERHRFDLERVRREGSPAQQAALFGLLPADVDRAQEAQYAYEDGTCGTAPSPPAADVVFERDASSATYCRAVGALNGELDTIVASRFDPAMLRTFVTGDRFTEVLEALDAAAPPAIAADVEADTEWFRTRWSDVVGAYDYDLRSIYLAATPADLAVFNRRHPDVLEHTSRVAAYEEQVCESG
jgi:hypothetical protein